MSRTRTARAALLLSATLALACDDQRYVSPDTVALVVSDAATGAKRLSECQYVPVLLGSRNVAHYSVDADLEVTLDITRDEVRVSFEGPSASAEPFVVSTSRFEEVSKESDPAPPSGYAVDLSAPCTP